MPSQRVLNRPHAVVRLGRLPEHDRVRAVLLGLFLVELQRFLQELPLQRLQPRLASEPFLRHLGVHVLYGGAGPPALGLGSSKICFGVVKGRLGLVFFAGDQHKADYQSHDAGHDQNGYG